MNYKTKHLLPIAIVVIVFVVFGIVDNYTSSNNGKSVNIYSGPIIEKYESKYQEGINLIKQAKWDEAQYALVEADAMGYRDGKSLRAYAYAKKYETEGNYFIANYWCKKYIPEYYNGEMVEEIKKFKNEIAIKAEQQTKEESIQNTERKKADLDAHKIWIGMSQGEAEISRGKPNNINRTVTKYGTHEQWCYNGGVYLYFDNGILTSWQD